MPEPSTIVIIIVAALILLLLVKLLKTPLRWAWKLLLNALGGFVALFVINLLGELVGMSLDLTWPNAIVVGVLGLPGVVLLIILKYIF